MKKHVSLLFALLFVSVAAMAQDFEAPKRGAKIYAQSYSIDLDVNTEATFDLWIVRSRYAKKTNILAPTFISSSGLSFEVVQDTQDQDHYTVTVSANDVAAGAYTSTVSARSTGTQKVTGTTLSFNVTPGKAVATKDGE